MAIGSYARSKDGEVNPPLQDGGRKKERRARGNRLYIRMRECVERLVIRVAAKDFNARRSSAPAGEGPLPSGMRFYRPDSWRLSRFWLRLSRRGWFRLRGWLRDT